MTSRKTKTFGEAGLVMFRIKHVRVWTSRNGEERHWKTLENEVPQVKNTLPNTSYPRDKLALEYLTDEKRKRIEYDVHHLVELCYACSLAAGWHTDENGEPIQQNHGERIALMHSELSEALEAIRTDARSTKTPDFSGVEEELADAVIRIADYAGRNGLDLGGAIAAKLVYNAGRADHKRAVRNAPGGKKF